MDRQQRGLITQTADKQMKKSKLRGTHHHSSGEKRGTKLHEPISADEKVRDRRRTEVLKVTSHFLLTKKFMTNNGQTKKGAYCNCHVDLCTNQGVLMATSQLQMTKKFMTDDRQTGTTMVPYCICLKEN